MNVRRIRRVMATMKGFLCQSGKQIFQKKCKYFLQAVTAKSTEVCRTDAYTLVCRSLRRKKAIS